MDFTKWRHAFKLDPAKELTDEQLELIAESGTDGIILGGSDGVTLDNVLNLLIRIRRYSVSVALEVSTVESVTPGFDFYFIPTVLNSPKAEWITEFITRHREYGHMMNWNEIFVEGYCILIRNAKPRPGVTEVQMKKTSLHARMAEHLSNYQFFIWSIVERR